MSDTRPDLRWQDRSKWVEIAHDDFSDDMGAAIVALAGARDAAHRIGNQEHHARLVEIINELEVMRKFP